MVLRKRLILNWILIFSNRLNRCFLYFDMICQVNALTRLAAVPGIRRIFCISWSFVSIKRLSYTGTATKLLQQLVPSSDQSCSNGPSMTDATDIYIVVKQN